MRNTQDEIFRRMQEELKGKVFQLPRSYGHADYKVLGGHEEWHEVRDAIKFYGFLNDRGQWEFSYSPDGFCLAAIRMGGYDGHPTITLKDMLEPYRQELLAD